MLRNPPGRDGDLVVPATEKSFYHRLFVSVVLNLKVAPPTEHVLLRAFIGEPKSKEV